MLLREEVIDIMTNAVNEMNVKIMEEMGAPLEQVNEFIVNMEPELRRVNGMLFDTLKDHGIIP